MPDKRANRTSQVLARYLSGYPTYRELACAAGADYKWEGVSRHFSADALAIVRPGEFGKLDLYRIQLGLSGLAYGASRNRTGCPSAKIATLLSFALAFVYARHFVGRRML